MCGLCLSCGGPDVPEPSAKGKPLFFAHVSMLVGQQVLLCPMCLRILGLSLAEGKD